ncbi:hypothetical protein BD779DRAFT_104674 [Infundibulicybe gibba]|nr:hypothetical protein BD779DRAFT_104674 [Infundibulicybe gibba]
MSQALEKQEAANAARRQIDQEILTLKTRRNTIASINQLPLELLSKIFASCVIRNTKSWVRNVTHICHHWRAVALDSPQLWSVINIDGNCATTWAEIMFRRSKMANLSITITRPSPQVATIVGLVLGHPERIEALHIAGGNITQIKQVFPFLTSPAPLLSTFSLNLPEYNSPLPILDHIFNGETPRLRQLELTGCYYPDWDSPMLCNLTSLKMNVKPTTRPTTKQFATMLKNSCCVRHLELFNCLPAETDVATLPALGEVIFLQNLAELRINSSASACANILNQVSFRPSATIRLDIDSGESYQPEVSGTQLPRLFSSLARSSDTVKAAPFREVSLSVSYQSLQLRMVIKPSANIHQAIHKEEGFLVECTFKPLTRPSVTEQLLGSALPSISLKHLARLRLHFTNNCTISTSAWLACLREMPVLQWVFLNGTCNFFQALRLDLDSLIYQEKQSTERYNVNLPRAAVLPKLQNICLDDMDFSQHDTPLAELLADLFIERYERGAILDELHLEGCRAVRETEVSSWRRLLVR